jgi:PLP dependent protein
MNSEKNNIEQCVRRIQKTIPPGVLLLASAKNRSLEEVERVIHAGVTTIGHNFVQEALPFIQAIGPRATWHMIGHLQSNKAKLAAEHFDMIETVDSWKLALTLESACNSLQKPMPVLMEINSGREANKTGVLPEAAEELAMRLSTLKFLHLEGLMTMGPRFGDPEDSRPYFKATRAIFERLAPTKLPNISMRYLSMGMSNSYQIAVEEGANIVRIGTKLFSD